MQMTHKHACCSRFFSALEDVVDLQALHASDLTAEPNNALQAACQLHNNWCRSRFLLLDGAIHPETQLCHAELQLIDLHTTTFVSVIHTVHAGRQWLMVAQA